MTLRGGDEPTTLPPEDAFNALGNESRIGILRILGEADEPLPFTELRKRLGIERGGEFNYHLEKLVGHFVEKTEDGYALQTPGERVLQAVQSGAVTEDPGIETTRLDQACYHCGAPVVMMSGSNLSVFCINCTANYEIPVRDASETSALDDDTEEIGLLGGFELPPAGIQGRSGIELLRAGTTWATMEQLLSRADICPRCSAKIDASIQVCETHDPDDGACDECGNRHAVMYVHECANCNYARMTQFGRILLAETALLNFFTSHDINPIAPDSPMAMRGPLNSYDEEVVSADPFSARFTFTVDDDSITLTVNEDLAVVDVSRRTSHVPGR